MSLLDDSAVACTETSSKLPVVKSMSSLSRTIMLPVQYLPVNAFSIFEQLSLLFLHWMVMVPYSKRTGFE